MTPPEHLAKAERAIFMFIIAVMMGLGSRILAGQTLDYAASIGVDNTGQDVLVDVLLFVSLAIVVFTLIPLYLAFVAAFQARQVYDEGYTRMWTAVTTYDMRLRLGLARPIRWPVREPKTYSEMVFGKREDA